MGGSGSGRRLGKHKLDGLPSIDLRYLKQNGFLAFGRTSTLSWSIRKKIFGYLTVTATSYSLLLRCRFRQSPGDTWTLIEQTVPLTWTPCNYGGKRSWMLCPDCGRRVLVLYVACVRFRCRHCLKLTYTSRNECDQDMQFRKIWKIREQLGAKRSILEPIGPKPKGMHRRTFTRLKRKAEKLEQQVWGAMREWLEDRQNNL